MLGSSDGIVNVSLVMPWPLSFDDIVLAQPLRPIDAIPGHAAAFRSVRFDSKASAVCEAGSSPIAI
jgi:hypothetical protein